jgi:hypothetical protein
MFCPFALSREFGRIRQSPAIEPGRVGISKRSVAHHEQGTHLDDRRDSPDRRTRHLDFPRGLRPAPSADMF